MVSTGGTSGPGPPGILRSVVLHVSTFLFAVLYLCPPALGWEHFQHFSSPLPSRPVPSPALPSSLSLFFCPELILFLLSVIYLFRFQKLYTCSHVSALILITHLTLPPGQPQFGVWTSPKPRLSWKGLIIFLFAPFYPLLDFSVSLCHFSGILS